MHRIWHILIVLCLLFGGCATVKVVDRSGQPIPDHVVRANIPSLGLRVDFALIHYYWEQEGDEYLDAYEYLDLHADHNTINSKPLRSLTLALHILNPGKEQFRLLYYYQERKGEDIGGKVEVLYRGNLSRKQFTIDLPTDKEGVEYKVWFEIKDNDNLTCFISPDVHYGVVGKPVSRYDAFQNSK